MSNSYDRVAITLHWASAAAIFVLLFMGKWMTAALEARSAPQMILFQAYQMHKSIGLTVLTLTLLRLLWRLSHRAPPLPAAMSRFEVACAAGAHILFYLLMIGLPLTGWAMVSSSPWGVPTIWFGLFEWPHLPILPELQDKKSVEDGFKAAHELAGNAMILLIIVHIAAALGHQFLRRDEVLGRMVPLLRRRRT